MGDFRIQLISLSDTTHPSIWVILNWGILSDTLGPLNLGDIKLEDIEWYNTPLNLSDIKLEDIEWYKTLFNLSDIKLKDIEWYNTPPNLSDIKLEDIE